jgi:starch phosphorylase
VAAFRRALADNLYYTRGQATYGATPNDMYMILAYTIRDHLMRRWRKTVNAYYKSNPKFVHYLSAEYLLGRQLPQNMLYSDTEELARQTLAEFNLNLDDFIDLDLEPGLGNGGLGRLAACFLDSMATLNIPSIGYGIRYEFGIFQQSFKDGWQVESPDNWLHLGNPWEFSHPDDMVEVKFGGYTEGYADENGHYRVRWIPDTTVMGEPYHTMVPGYNSGAVNMLRLWRARASKEFDFQLFDVGDYAKAVEQKVHSESISKVLYPNDSTPQGKELRLRQQYFFVACSIQDIIRLYRHNNQGWEAFPDKVVIQLNDTHPVIAIPELMRVLLDENGLGWDLAWDITRRTFASTQHTLLPEALEKWPVDLFNRLLPRHLEIVYEINHRLLNEVEKRFPNDPDRLARMSIIEESPEKSIRMAFLACTGSFSVNGVAELQSRLLKERVFRDFYEMWPAKFNNKTNGVTPRRFMRLANPALSELISSKIGQEWLTDLDQLERLEAFVDDPEFGRTWRQVKQENKKALTEIVRQKTGIELDPNSIFDIMAKRLHEYKRQLLKALHIVTLYNRLKANPELEMAPRTFIFGAKAAPGYHMAKLIIKLINSIAEVVNNDADVRGRLKVVFLPNFNVSLAEKIYPAADVSEQISLAGKEASGTGNMKFALNGAVTVGTLDGANIEIRERVGEENFFLFGLTTEEVFALKESNYDPMAYYNNNAELKAAVDSIAAGDFTNGDMALVRPIVDSLLYHDEYLLLIDYESYVKSQDALAEAYQDKDRWTRMSILNVARCGFFSSDRTIRQYAEEIWNVKPVEVEGE